MKKIIIIICCLISPIAYAAFFVEESPEVKEAFFRFVEKAGGLQGAACTLLTKRDCLDAQYKDCKQRLESLHYFAALHAKNECKELKKERKKVDSFLVYILKHIIDAPQIGLPISSGVTENVETAS